EGDSQAAAADRQQRRSASGPHTLEQQSDDIFGDVDEDTFGVPASYGSAHAPARSVGSRRSFTRDFEDGRDDISKLALDDYFAAQEPPDVADEYEVVGGQALSPTSPVHPSYTRREPAAGVRRYTGVPIQPVPRQPPVLSPRNSGGSAASRRHSLTDRDAALFVGDAEDLAFSDVSEDESSIDLRDYAGLSGDSDSGSDLDGVNRHQQRRQQQQQQRSLRLQSRFAAGSAAPSGSVVLEPARQASRYAAQRPADVHPPRARFIDLPSDAGSSVPVKVTVPDDVIGGQFIGDSAQAPPARADGQGGFGIIDDYFGAPGADETCADEGEGGLPAGEGAVLSLAVDVARIEVRLYAGQDWFAPAEHTPPPPAADDLGIIPTYMDALDDAEDPMADHGYARTSASLPDDRGLYGFYGSPLESPQRPPPAPRSGPGRRSAAPKIRLRATQVHSEFRQFAASSATAFELGLSIDALEILDELESSEWSKFLTRRRDGETGLPATLHSLATARNRQLLTACTGDADRVTGARMRRQRSS
ncbi:hypothetical protein H4R21_005747, partial [Coemansia helicoidea]